MGVKFPNDKYHATDRLPKLNLDGLQYAVFYL